MIDALADLLLGARCPGCEAARWGFCPDCLEELVRSPEPAPRFAGLTIVAANPYRPLLASAIPRYKDEGALHLEAVLAGRLAMAVRACGPPGEAVLVPVPSLAASVRRRGFDHGARLAARAARELGLGSAKALRRVNAGRDQEGLGARQRRENLRGSMRARHVPRPIVLVDDVVTTGSSLREAWSALERSGCRVVAAAVIADADDHCA